MKRISAARVARLITGWQAGSKTLAERLSRVLGEVIAARELPVGALLPSQRELAATLRVSRGTVTVAYDLLREAGLLYSQQGSGYRIIASSNSPGEVHNRLIGEVLCAPQDLDMSSGALPASPVLTDLLAEFQGRHLAGAVKGLGYHAHGLPELRSAVARYYCDLGLPTRAEHILITSGAQQAVWLLANALVDSADLVLLENPSYRGSLEVFRRRNARLAGMAVTPDGLDWKTFEHLLDQAKSMYVFSECQNPTGRSMDEASRRHLAGLLERSPAFLVEDGAQSELSLDGKPSVPLAALCHPERVATIGTLSKLFWGGLRVGWIRTSANIVHRLASMKAVNDLGSSFFDQSIAVKLFERLPQARAWRNKEIGAALKTVEKLIRRHGGQGWQWTAPAGGTALWIRIPDVDTVALCQAAARRGLLLSAGPAYSAAEDFTDCIRLPFVRSEAAIAGTLETIAQLLPRPAARNPRQAARRASSFPLPMS